MYCYNCGKLADTGDKFCTNCGTKLLEKIEEELDQSLNEKNWKFTGASNNMIIKHHLDYFRDAILKDKPLESEKIIQKYQTEGICDNSGKITEKGLVVAISYLPLDEQCEALGIELENKQIDIDRRAETSALDYYIKQGYRGCYSEGMIIGVILYCLCCKKLFPLDLVKVNKGSGYSRGFISFTEYSDTYRSELINLIENADEKIVKKNFKKILKKQYYYFRKLWESQGINEELVIKIYNALGNKEFVNIGKLYFKGPFVYQKGWPDLAIVMYNRAKFIEVKTKDKLRRSQIITISDLKRSTGLDISVLKVI
jgi:hypothetical protein